MFASFFPRPRLFLLTSILWAIFGVAGWYSFGAAAGQALGLNFPAADAEPAIGLGFFFTADFIWFYIYYALMVAIFAGVWFRLSPHPWQRWSVLGTALILFSTYFGVQVSVAINHWRKPFFDMVQDALTGEGNITPSDLYVLIIDFAGIAFERWEIHFGWIFVCLIQQVSPIRRNQNTYW